METAYSISRPSASSLSREGTNFFGRGTSESDYGRCNVAQVSVSCRLTSGLRRGPSGRRSPLHDGASSLCQFSRGRFKVGTAKATIVKELLGVCLKCRTKRTGRIALPQRQLVAYSSVLENLGEQPPIWGIQLIEGLSVGTCPRNAEDFDWVTESLGADAMLCLEDDAGLAQLGWEWEAVQQRMEALGGVALRVPMKDSDRADQATVLPEAVRVLGVLLGAGRSVYVCSAMGGHRAPLVVVGYLALVRGIARDRALEILKGAHPEADPPLDCLDSVRARVLAEHGASVKDMARKVYEGRMETGQPGGPEQDWKEAEDRVVTRVFQDAVESRLALVGTLSRASVGALARKMAEESKDFLAGHTQAEAEEGSGDGDVEAEDGPAGSVLDRIRKQMEAAASEAAEAKAQTEEMADRTAKLEKEVQRLRRLLREARGGSVPDVDSGPAPVLGSEWDPSSDGAYNGAPLAAEPEFLPSFLSGGEGLFTGQDLDRSGPVETEGGDRPGEEHEATHPKVNGFEVYETGGVPSMEWSGQILDLPSLEANDYSLEALVNEGVALSGRRPPATGEEGAELAGSTSIPSVENDEIVFRLRADAVKAAEDYEEAKRRADRLAEEVEAARRFVELIKLQAASSGIASPPLTEPPKETDNDANLAAPAQHQLASKASPAGEASIATSASGATAAAAVAEGHGVITELKETTTQHSPESQKPPVSDHEHTPPPGALFGVGGLDGVRNWLNQSPGGATAAGNKGWGDADGSPGKLIGGGLQAASFAVGIGLGLLMSIAAFQLRPGGGVESVGRAFQEQVGSGEVYVEQVSELQEKLSDLGASLTIAMDARAIAEADMELLRADAREAAELRSTLETRLAEEARALDRVRAELAGLRADRDRTQQEKMALEVQLAEEQEEGNEVRARLKEVRNVAEGLRQDREALTKNLEAKAAAETALSSEVAELKRAREELQQARVALEKKARDAGDEGARLRQELEDARRQLADEVQKKALLRGEFEGVRQKLGEDKLRAETRLREEIQDLKRKEAESEARLESELAVARSDLSKVSKEREALRGRLEEEERVERRLQNELEASKEGRGSIDGIVEGSGSEEGAKVAEGTPARRRFL